MNIEWHEPDPDTEPGPTPQPDKPEGWRPGRLPRVDTPATILPEEVTDGDRR